MARPTVKAVLLSPQRPLGDRPLLVVGPSLGTSSVLWTQAAALLGTDFDRNAQPSLASVLVQGDVTRTDIGNFVSVDVTGLMIRRRSPLGSTPWAITNCSLFFRVKTRVI